jgi:hypothetical protein
LPKTLRSEPETMPDVTPSVALNWEFVPNARFILCEGDDDKGLLETIAALPDMPRLQVRHSAECNELHTGGRPGFEHSINGFSIVSNYRLVSGFVFVTDNDNAEAFTNTCNTLARTVCRVPTTFDDIGELDGRPLRILLSPSGNHGDLEKLCFDVLATKWPDSVKCVDAFLECTGASKWETIASINKARARAMIIGSNEDDPYKGIGHLFRKGVLSVAHPALEPLVKALQNIDKLLGLA